MGQKSPSCLLLAKFSNVSLKICKNSVLTTLQLQSVILGIWPPSYLFFKILKLRPSQTHAVTPKVFSKDSKINDAGFEFLGLIICSADLSGCGIIPTTFPSVLHIPAILIEAPLISSA